MVRCDSNDTVTKRSMVILGKSVRTQGEDAKANLRWDLFQESYPNLIEQLDLPVEGAVDVLHIEERIIPDLNEQVLGEIADIILAEVPLAQNPAGDDHLGVLMAALTEVLAQVLTVPQPLDII